MTGMESSPIRIGAWRVDPSREQIAKDGQTIKLERRLMQLLICLATRPGQIFSVDELLDTVWTGVIVTPDSVYHAVASLRRILGDDKKTPTYITNTPRRGYSLIAPVSPWVDTEPPEDAPKPDSIESPPPKVMTVARPLLWLIVVASIAILALAAKYLMEHRATAAPPVDQAAAAPAGPIAKPAPVVYSPKSIAVLPFEDLSEHKDQQFFADGMAEEIIDRLVQVPDLRVPARTSSFYFKGKSSTVPQIAAELGVANVLEGSVRTAGNRVRIVAQLVRADDGYHVWSQTYDRELQDIFAVQDEIATAIAAALQISLAGGPLTRERGGTKNLDAYQLYLRGRATVTVDGTSDSVKKGESMLKQAVKIDPHFGLAWGALAGAPIALVGSGDLPAVKGYAEAQRYALRAVEVSPEVAQSHAILAYLYRTRDWNWDASRKEIQLGLSADPVDPICLMFDGLLAKTLGQHDKAERQLRAAVDRDPLFTYANFHLGNSLYLAGKFVQADTALRRVLEISPQFWSRPYLAKTLLAEGKPQDALELMEHASETDKLDLLPIILFANGRASEGERALQALIAKHAATDAYSIAMTYAYRQDTQLALTWFERAYTQKDPGLLDMMGEPLLSNITSEVRYQAILRAMNLTQ